MRAIVWTRYGPPDSLQLKEVAKPGPKDDEVLIRIHATAVTTGDGEMRRFKSPFLYWLPLQMYLGFVRPRRNILGQELAGEIESVGKDVKQFRKGDLVFGTTGSRFGAYAEYTCLSTKSKTSVLAAKPANMTYAEAAAVPVGGMTALHFLREGSVQSGQKILIIGAQVALVQSLCSLQSTLRLK